MKRRSLVIGAVVLAVLLLANAFIPTAVGQKRKESPAAEEAGRITKGDASRILLKNGQHLLILQPRTKMVGGQAFVGGMVIEAQPAAGWMQWVPVSEVAQLDEFSDIWQLNRVYRVPAGPKPAVKK
jgi:hypothetical protein